MVISIFFHSLHFIQGYSIERHFWMTQNRLAYRTVVMTENLVEQERIKGLWRRRVYLNSGQNQIVWSSLWINCELQYIVQWPLKKTAPSTRCATVVCTIHRWNDVLLDSEESIHSAVINDTSYESPKCFSLGKKLKIFFFWKKKSKWPTKKKLIFQFRQFSIFFRENFMDWSFG